MLEKFLKDVIAIVVGKPAEHIVDLLISEKYVNEFLIAKKMDFTINQTRNILYKIADYGLVSSTRKKDKKKGWYTYSWKIEILKSLLFLRGSLVKKIEQINNQINSRETKQFYVCERCNIEVHEENAMLYNFTCNECGDIFVLKDNKKFLRDLRGGLSRLNKELGLINEEIEKQRIKVDKKKMRELKKQEKKKALERKKAAAVRKALREKTAKKAGKEKPVRKKLLKKKKKPARKKPAKKKLTKGKPTKGRSKAIKRKKKVVKKKIKAKPKKKGKR